MLLGKLTLSLLRSLLWMTILQEAENVMSNFSRPVYDLDTMMTSDLLMPGGLVQSDLLPTDSWFRTNLEPMVDTEMVSESESTGMGEDNTADRYSGEVLGCTMQKEFTVASNPTAGPLQRISALVIPDYAALLQKPLR